MDRRKFLEQIGVGAAFALTATCLGGCKTESVSPVDFTIDLNDSAYSALKTNGGFVIKNDAVIARTTTGGYAAATVIWSRLGSTPTSKYRPICDWHLRRVYLQHL